MPVYDKPMIYYPLSTLMLSGITDIAVITNPQDANAFKALLGDGSSFGIQISYIQQSHPRGLAEAFILAADFIADSKVALALGDNLLYGPGLGRRLQEFTNIEGALIFGYEVADPSAYGVVELSSDGKPTALVEKPINPKSNFAVPGLYFYDNQVVEYAHSLKPSTRGELEITDLNKIYLGQSRLEVELLPRGTAWLDTGTFDQMTEAADYVKTIEKRTGMKIGSPEEVAWRRGWLSDEELQVQAEKYLKSGYGQYLLDLLKREKR
jgi:glucose-1-phosphate thymidylyltransferase